MSRTRPTTTTNSPCGSEGALLHTYEPDADRVSECYPLRGGDMGIHVLLAPADRNEKATVRFPRQGFEAGPMVVLPETDLPDVYLPEKKAQLAFLRRAVAFPNEP